MRGWQPDSTGTARDVHSVGSEEEAGFARGGVECCDRGDTVVKQAQHVTATTTTIPLAPTTIIFIVVIAITLGLTLLTHPPTHSHHHHHPPPLGCSKGILGKIKAIEDEMASTQKNKATEYHLGKLKARLAALRSELINPKTHGGGASERERAFEASRAGDARVALIGFPSVGKSTFLTNLTNTTSRVAGYEFTTLTCIPGIFEYKQAKIQILDLPGIIEGAAMGIGRGRQVIASARSADLVILFMDAKRAGEQRQMLEHELAMMGIRLNQDAPNVVINKLSHGPITFTSTYPLDHFDKKLAMEILNQRKIRSAEVHIREKDLTIERFIDAVEDNVKYIPALYVCNKIDTTGVNTFKRLGKSKNYVLISCNRNWNMDGVKEAIYQALCPIRVYTKLPQSPPDLDQPVILCKGRHNVADLCRSIHTSLADPRKFYYANVWGTSVKFRPQRVGLAHQLHDEDVVQIMVRKDVQAE